MKRVSVTSTSFRNKLSYNINMPDPNACSTDDENDLPLLEKFHKKFSTSDSWFMDVYLLSIALALGFLLVGSIFYFFVDGIFVINKFTQSDY